MTRKSISAPERGQILIMSALLIPVLLGFAALAVDIGSYAAERRSLQNDADAIALAAAQDLPNSSAALTSAQSWMTKNGVDASHAQVTVSGGSVNPTVRVVISKSHNFSFIGALGVGSQNVGAVAAAGKFSFGAGAGVVPWSITQATYDAASPGTTITMKYDANGGANGNFGAIRVDGSGSSDYESAATYGSQTVICAVSETNCTIGNCPGSYPGTCAEDSPECDGPECAPKTGNMTGPTRNAVDFRMQHTSSQCDTFDEVFTPAAAYLPGLPQQGDPLADEDIEIGVSSGGRMLSPAFKQPTDTPTTVPTSTNTPVTPTSTPVPPTNTPVPPTNTPGPTNTVGPATATSTPGGPTSTPTAAPTSTPSARQKYSTNQSCNPWGAGACPPGQNTALCSRRVIIIPIIDQFGNGSSDPVTIQKFALVYLEGYDNGKCQGNSCEIHGRFVNADITTGALAGAYDANAPVQFTKLIE